MVGGRCILKVTPKVVWGKVLPDFVNAVFHPPCHSMVCPHVGMGKERIMKSKRDCTAPLKGALPALPSFFSFLLFFPLQYFPLLTPKEI